MIKKNKRTHNEKLFILCMVTLVTLSLFTVLQAYYRVYIHLAVFLLCYLTCSKEQKYTTAFVSTSLVLCVVFCMMSLMKGHGLATEHMGLFLHYTTWPVLFVFVIKKYDAKSIKKILYMVIVMCIISDILSLIQLGINPEISRSISGMYTAAEATVYYKKGVGGYGYTYAMAFLTFGVVLWLKNTSDRREKLLLITFLIINSLFIIQASFTLAIVMALVVVGLAMVSGMRSFSRVVIITIVIVLILIFAMPILQFGYDLANDLDLPWVVKRLGQLIEAIEQDDMSSLKRYELYKESWDTFVLRPIFGAIQEKGDTWGGHSQILDTMAQYGLFASLLPAFLMYCKNMCCRHITNFKLTTFYLVFVVFIFIDTCTAMQLPVVLYFVVPLIAYLESEGKLNENRNSNLSLGS